MFESFFATLPTVDERLALIDGLAELVKKRGPAPLATWPLIMPTDEFFPDRWSPDVEGVRLMTARLLRYAG